MRSHGRPPKKQKKNISGLSNQSLASVESPTLSGASTDRSGSPAGHVTPDEQIILRADNFSVVFDSTRVNWEEEEKAPTEVSDVDDEWILISGMTRTLRTYWWNWRRRRTAKMRTGFLPERPKEYIKGPNVMSKSARTQRRYRADFVNQSKLTD
ncbi:hypothetical protein BC835DRAFT_1311810, partial [Cytidiella melzeri]